MAICSQQEVSGQEDLNRSKMTNLGSLSSITVLTNGIHFLLYEFLEN
jgi:hypothetical protein